MTKYLSIFSFILLFSCKSEQNPNDPINYDAKTGTIIIDSKFLKKNNLELKNIVIRSKKNLNQQRIILDSNLVIRNLVNHKNIFWKANYTNSNIAFDSDGNFEFAKSYYYETYLYSINPDEKRLAMEVTLQNQRFPNSKKYILIGKLDDAYRFTGDIDTILFKDRNATILIDNPKKGWNEVKFLIVEDQKVKNKTNRSIIYAKQNFFLDEQ